MRAPDPSGVVTFLFTDIEGSTRRWEADADAMRAALLAHDDVLRTAIERLAAAPADDGLVARDIWLLRLRALLARTQGDDTAYRDHWDRYRTMATSLGFEGHMKWAEAMP